MKLKNKVALVTGGGTGIGRAISLEFASEGADVAVGSRNMSNLENVCKEINAKGRRSLAVTADVCIKVQVENMVKQVIDKFGRIDILVNNSGTSRMSPIIEFTEEDWDVVINTNVKGVFLCTQAVARHMVRQKYGKIINISSTSSLGAIDKGQSAYCSSKFAVNGFTKACAMEFGSYGINVNAIAPGRIMTSLVYSTRTPEQVKEFMDVGKEAAVLGRMGTVEDIAHLALFLASDDSSFITAEVIASNGGRTNLMGR
jgi:NAD(P)-dependent dehydrogenase (short-subunit alcohol dehydrogenase family)